MERIEGYEHMCQFANFFIQDFPFLFGNQRIHLLLTPIGHQETSPPGEEPGCSLQALFVNSCNDQGQVM